MTIDDGTSRYTSPPSEAPTIRVVAMPADTNPAGDIFGGWIMSQMDLAAGSRAAQRARGRCVTIAVESLTFHQPVVIGDEVSIYTRIIKTGRTSMVIHVETWRRERHARVSFKVTEGIFTFVAINSERRPRPLPDEGD
ncbi:acyl-CoA thioester hydrolase [Ameyamaea chiangmaiensis NBRC 103196]|uniref:Acyl-CoA thioesterase n=1 Tax=Ameyamaea chiangmaiensis TaxID=442969 RepID=A0A850PG29_9PROT|nr:acyl-CoA thioesterase [Ameyamaea chiangmaiensis]MBS4076021.1 acyl-CoA thioesterase [Ameyamaea chiangmaiensis]NVN40111.1 acyl-CoA thioesterase [Ameyamaea chiangmaiensis]GBQ61434.1 acyl-CoA thioester hydrolase [Ameyamaea chiangmaiensis NBRC 103196]